MQSNVPAAVEAERQQRKAAMRAMVLASRDARPAALRASDSIEITRRIASLASWGQARTVLLTLPFRNEWDTWPLVEAARASGKRIALPRVVTASRTLDLHLVGDPRNDTAPGYGGIPEPRIDLPRLDAADVDWILVPGVAFDAAGGRLGYGAGYYDRLLAGVPPSVPRIAGAFDLQVVDDVPRQPHDLRVDVLATPTRMLVAA